MARRERDDYDDQEEEKNSDPEQGVFVERIGGKKGGVNVTIKADARTGHFIATVAGDSFWAATRDDLIVQLVKAVKKTRVTLNVPLTLIGRVSRTVKAGVGSYKSWTTHDAGVGYEHVTLVGRHARTGRVLLRNEDGTKCECEQYSSKGTLCRRLTQAEAEQYTKLHTEYVRAQKAYEKFERRVEIKDPEKFVAKQIAAAADTAVEAPEEDADPR